MKTTCRSEEKRAAEVGDLLWVSSMNTREEGGSEPSMASRCEQGMKGELLSRPPNRRSTLVKLPGWQ